MDLKQCHNLDVEGGASYGFTFLLAVLKSPKYWAQDVESLLHTARRRATDEKAAVRKAGLQLLEALLVLRASGAGGAPRELPTEDDIAAVEAAAGDALVSVRKAGLAAAARLLRELPAETAVAALWIRAALPMVRLEPLSGRYPIDNIAEVWLLSAVNIGH